MSKDLPDQPEQIIGQSGDRLIQHGNITNSEIRELGQSMTDGPPADFSSLNRAATLIDPEAQSIATTEAMAKEAKAKAREAQQEK